MSFFHSEHDFLSCEADFPNIFVVAVLISVFCIYSFEAGMLAGSSPGISAPFNQSSAALFLNT